MNWFQRAGRYIFGGHQPKRSYDGAKAVARFGDFSRSNLSANAELDVSLAQLRNRLRGLFRNEPFFRRWVRQLTTNVVGPQGFRLKVHAKNTNGGVDRYGNDQIEDAWAEWSERCSADGLMGFRDMTSLAVRTWARDGEAFFEKVVGSRFGPHGLAYSAFEADLVDETYNKRLGNNAQIRQGIEIDKYGRPLAYHVLVDHPGDAFVVSGNVRRRRVPADRIIHVYLKERPGQVRGEPQGVAVMTALKMLSGYREAEVTGRRLAASKMGFFKRLLGVGSGDIAPLADSELDDGQLEMEVHPGRLSVLPAGVEFEKFDMTTFTTDYEQFERQILRSIAAGLDVAYSNISMDSSNSSYSADRSDQIKQRDVWREMQTMLLSQFVRPIYDTWLQHVFEMRFVSLPSYRIDKFLKASKFIPRGWSWVDPDKEIRSAVTAIDRGLTSATRIAAEQGRDLVEVYDEIQAEREMAKERGLDFRSPDMIVANQAPAE